jgi:hypothetical protein
MESAPMSARAACSASRREQNLRITRSIATPGLCRTVAGLRGIRDLALNAAHEDANIISGASIDENMGDASALGLPVGSRLCREACVRSSRAGSRAAVTSSGERGHYQRALHVAR